MSASVVLTRLKEAGVTVAVADGQLKLKGPKSVLNDDVLSELRAIKAELITLLSQPEADATAVRKPPSPPQPDADEVAERITSWLEAMDRLPKACGPYGLRLKTITTDFALGCWAYPAVQHGWTDADLFALDGGLISEMSRRALHFRAINEDAISLINGRGAFEEWPRRDMTDAVPWWEDERCVTRFH